MFVVLKRQRFYRYRPSCCSSSSNKDAPRTHPSLFNMLGGGDFPIPPKQREALLKNAKPFIEEALRFVDEAKRSVLIGNTFNARRRVKDMCSEYGSVEQVHCVDSNSNDQRLLVTFKKKSSADALMHSCQPRKTYSFRSRFSRYIICKPSQLKASSQKSNQNAARPSSRMALKKEVTNCRGLGECVNTVWTALTPSAQQIRNSYLQCQIVDDVMGDNMAECVTFPHGSLLSGLATVDADLDMVLHPLGLFKYGLFPPSEKAHSGTVFLMPNTQLQVSSERMEHFERELISFVGYSLKHFAMPRCKQVIPLPQAKVPIVRFRSGITNTGCDISISLKSPNDGVISSCMLRRVLAHNNYIHPLSHCLRLWARQWKLTSSSPGQYLINFSLTHLLIFYMQSIGECPSMSTLLSSNPSSKDLLYAKPNSDLVKLGQLYLDFLQFWSKFDYSSVIDIYEGQTLKVSDMFDQAEFRNTPLKILNTQNNAKNISHRMSKQYLEMFVEQCTQTHQTLTANGSKMAELFCTSHKL